MHQSTFISGQWKAVCDRCGAEYHAKQLRQEWTGLRVCSGRGTRDCWEPHHPQEFVRGVKDKQAPPWVRPEPVDVDVSPGSGNEVSRDDL
jgi:hypothetical protein